MPPSAESIADAERAARQARIERNNLERLLDAYEQSIRWHEAAIKRHNAEIARLNGAHSEMASAPCARPKETEQTPQ